MRINDERFAKACRLLMEDLSEVATKEESGFSFVAEFHIDQAGYVRSIKHSKAPNLTTRTISR